MWSNNSRLYSLSLNIVIFKPHPSFKILICMEFILPIFRFYDAKYIFKTPKYSFSDLHGHLLNLVVFGNTKI